MNAFPSGHDPKTGTADKGMKLRDYFAAKALQGMLAEPSLKATPQEFAERAYMVADAMLKERDLWPRKMSQYMWWLHQQS